MRASIDQTTAAAKQHHHLHNGRSRSEKWPGKADLFVVRTDGMSCARETVEASGCLSFGHPSSQQLLLVWNDRPKSVMVLKKLDDELLGEFVRALSLLALNEKMKVIVEPHEHEKLTKMGIDYVDTYNESEENRLQTFIDFVVCLGGDGVILHASSLFQTAVPPVLSFNLGSLGFLTNHYWQNFHKDVANVIQGCERLDHCMLDDPDSKGVHITLRMRLECTILRRDARDTPEPAIEVLNEVVVDRGSGPYLTKIECWERDHLITKVQADGVMLATPTGSTAYSVAAGGSMVHPNVPAILFTPICPHSLSFKPVVLPDYAEIELRISADARCGAWVCFDGKRRQELQRGDAVRVRMSCNPVPTVSRNDQTVDWFGSLERCFSWNERPEQKAFK